MPLRHRLVFERSNEFRQDAVAHADEIDRERYPLLTEQQAVTLSPGLVDMHRAFCAADWLAMHYQKRFLWALRVSHVCVFLTGLAYVSYTDFNSDRAFLFVVFGLIVVATLFNYLARRGAWHREYLDCRTLAEGLRCSSTGRRPALRAATSRSLRTTTSCRCRTPTWAGSAM